MMMMMPSKDDQQVQPSVALLTVFAAVLLPAIQ
jgi:hypothetical protein